SDRDRERQRAADLADRGGGALDLGAALVGPHADSEAVRARGDRGRRAVPRAARPRRQRGRDLEAAGRARASRAHRGGAPRRRRAQRPAGSGACRCGARAGSCAGGGTRSRGGRVSVAWTAYRLVATGLGWVAPAARILTSPLERPLWGERMG